MVDNKNEKGNQLYLEEIMHSIKRFTARECNKLLKRTGQFWQHESYDRIIRDRKELFYILKYVLDNPIKAGFCKKWEDWNWTYLKEEFYDSIK